MKYAIYYLETPTEKMLNSLPITTNGNCREFVTSVQVDKVLKQVRGTACLVK